MKKRSTRGEKEVKRAKSEKLHKKSRCVSRVWALPVCITKSTVSWTTTTFLSVSATNTHTLIKIVRRLRRELFVLQRQTPQLHVRDSFRSGVNAKRQGRALVTATPLAISAPPQPGPLAMADSQTTATATMSATDLPLRLQQQDREQPVAIPVGTTDDMAPTTTTTASMSAESTSAVVRTEYLSAGANRQAAVADWSADGTVAFGADLNVALWRPTVSSFLCLQHLFFFFSS